MGKKKRDDLEKEASQPVVESKRARRGAPKIEKEKPKKTSANEKSKDAGIKVGSGVVKKEVGSSEVSKNLKGQNVYTDTSSSSDSESEKTSNKNDKKSVTDSNSDSDSDSSDSSDSSPPSREGPEDSNKVKTHKSPAVTKEKNSVTNLMPVKSYVSPEKSSSSDSYHSDTEEEDKKRRKKQKKLLQMQLTKKAKKTNFHRAAEVKSEVQTDVDEDGGDNVNSNNDGT